MALALLLVLLAASPHAALAWLGAGAIDTSTPAWRYAHTHSWAVLLERGAAASPGTARATLVHIPPRRLAAEDGMARGAADGVVRVASRFNQAPAALAAVDRTVYAFFEPRPTAEVKRISVFSLSVEPSGVGDLWRFLPEGRMEAQPFIQSEGRVRGAAAWRDGPVVLIESGSPPRLSLLALVGGRWRPLPWPDGAPSAPPADAAAVPRDLLISTRAGPALVIPSGEGKPGLWVALPAPDARPADNDDPLPVRWRFEPLEALGRAWKPGSRLQEIAGRLILADPAPSGDLTLSEVLPGGATRPLATLTGVDRNASLASLDGVGRLAVVWAASLPPAASTPDTPATPDPVPAVGPGEPSPRPAQTAPDPAQIREVSVFTGRVLYSGQARSEGPISPGEFRAVVLTLLLLMGAVLILVMRAPPQGAWVLPKGVALAEPGRRFAATVIDAGVAVLVVRGLGLWPGSALDPLAWLEGSNWIALAAVAGAAVLIAAVCEGLWGRTVGKIFAGCEVIVLSRTGDEPPQPPGLARALLRNLVKWILPPVAALGVLDPEGMHRGDTLARTAVVVPIEDDLESQQD